MPKKGAEYELFVKDVYECLNRADGLSDVQIQHDVKLMGAAGVEHQIDIFWTFKIGGVNYKVAVECKDYNSHVSKEKIEAFHSILHDIGNIHGIFSSKMGFQSGAILYAATQVAKREENKDKTIVAIFPDTGLRYLSTNLFG